METVITKLLPIMLKFALRVIGEFQKKGKSETEFLFLIDLLSTELYWVYSALKFIYNLEDVWRTPPRYFPSTNPPVENFPLFFSQIFGEKMFLLLQILFFFYQGGHYLRPFVNNGIVILKLFWDWYQ